MKKNVSIQLVRIIATVLILLCHLVQEFGNTTIAMTGQFFNVGVQIFLFLSGYLYGKKNINDSKKWILSRLKKVIIPVYIFMIILFIIHFAMGSMNWKSLLVYLLNLQYFFGGLLGAGHLWFISVIFICYFITIFLSKQKNSKRVLIISLIVIITASISSKFNHKFSMLLFYIATYLIGYSYRRYENSINLRVRTVLIISLLSIILRLACRYLFDGTPFYDCIIVSLTQTILAISIFLAIKCLTKKFIITESKLINFLDDFSFYIYITHYMFMVGPIRTMGITNSLIINCFVTIFLSIMSATILKLLSNKAQQIIAR